MTTIIMKRSELTLNMSISRTTTLSRVSILLNGRVKIAYPPDENPDEADPEASPPGAPLPLPPPPVPLSPAPPPPMLLSTLVAIRMKKGSMQKGLMKNLSMQRAVARRSAPQKLYWPSTRAGTRDGRSSGGLLVQRACARKNSGPEMERKQFKS